MRKIYAGFVAFGLALSPSLYAESGAGSIVGKVGTLGVGLEYMYPVHNKVNIGVGVNKYTKKSDLNESGVQYNADLDFGSVSLLGHFHPAGNNFRISSGIFYNNNQISVTAKPGSNARYDFGGMTYNASDIASATGVIDFKSIAPYLGIGWGSSPDKVRKSFSFNADLGILFQGSPDVSLNVSCVATICNSLNDLKNLNDAVAREETELQDELDDYKIYPVLSLGASWSF